jgi:hypothetical protein
LAVVEAEVKNLRSELQAEATDRPDSLSHSHSCHLLEPQTS